MPRTHSPRPSADGRSAVDPSIDELDKEICTLASQLNARTYRMLVLVRELDDRVGWAKWGLSSCAEWLAWRCGMSVSAAREKVRTAQALRALPLVSMAFADGRLSYSKVRALTRAARDRAASRGALPANSQCDAGVDSRSVARLGATLALAVAR